MASRVCVGCGLTTDIDGRLIVNTGGAVWTYGCSEVLGVPIVCGSDGVLRSGMPEKSHIRGIQYSPQVSGQVTSATFGSPVIGGGNFNFGPPIVDVVANPSDCLAMRVFVRHGINHALFTKFGAGNSHVTTGTALTVTGSIIAFGDAHQQWRHDGSVVVIAFDSQNSTEVTQFILVAGGTATFSAQPYINVAAYNGNTTFANHTAVLDVDAFHN